MDTLKIFALAICCAILSACSGVMQSYAGDYDLQLDRAADRASVQLERDTAVIEIFSATGIGGGRIEPRAGVWPPRVRFVLHLQGLENFSLRAGDRRWRVEVGNDGRALIEGDAPAPIVRAPSEHGAPFEITLEIPQLAGARGSLRFSWVDFYRG